MDTLSGNKADPKSLPVIDAWEAALAAEDPAALLEMLACKPPPQILGLTPWPVLLARKVSMAQWWAASNWRSDFYEPWMKAWRIQPQVPYQHWPEILQEALMAMGKSETRFKPGHMYCPLWLSYVDEMVDMGMDINHPLLFGPTPCTALDFLLKNATQKPYPAIAVHWIEKHEAMFSIKSAEGAIEILERLQEPDLNTELVDQVIRRLFLALEDYEHATQVKISAWFDTLPQDTQDPTLMAYIEHLFLAKQTRASGSSGGGRRL